MYMIMVSKIGGLEIEFFMKLKYSSVKEKKIIMW